jgi:xanthine dehydrogenase accessory factor
MRDADEELLLTALGWLEAGATPLLVTVVETWGSAPRPAGSMAVLHQDGRIVGSVSGGCLEDDLISRIREGRWCPARPALLSYGGSPEEARRFYLPCGGRVRLLVEALQAPSELIALLCVLRERRVVCRELDLDSGATRLTAVSGETPFGFDGRRLHRVFGPVWRLLLIGAGEPSRFLAEIALGLGYQVVVCDPREEYSVGWSLEGARVDSRMPDDVVTDMITDERCAVVALTHDPRLDDLALMEALASRAFYVGALGSRASNLKRRQRLAWLGLSDECVCRLHGPVGLALGGRTPAEIAVSIAAELTAVRHGRLRETTADLKPPSVLAAG